jgi:serine/threonine-protein kinase PRP4
VKTLTITGPAVPLRDRVLQAARGTRDADASAIKDFIDLLERMLAWDPEKRISVKAAMSHPFVLSGSR